MRDAHRIALAALAVVVPLFGSPAAADEVSRFRRLVDEVKTEIEEIDTGGLLELQRSEPALVVLDVREKEEWDRGHLAGAQHLSRGVLEGKIEERVPDPSTPIVLYCASGNRSALAAYYLERMGYERVWSLRGGIRAIERDGLAVTREGAEAGEPAAAGGDEDPR